MYSCGPTVYNYFHVGNARPFIIFDLLRCYLEYRGYKVKFVQNFTDIDDKVINKANEEGVDFNTIAERYIKEYYVDAQGLGVKKASVHPRATETMDAIIDIVERLIENEFFLLTGQCVVEFHGFYLLLMDFDRKTSAGYRKSLPGILFPREA